MFHSLQVIIFVQAQLIHNASPSFLRLGGVMPLFCRGRRFTARHHRRTTLSSHFLSFRIFQVSNLLSYQWVKKYFGIFAMSHFSRPPPLWVKFETHLSWGKSHIFLLQARKKHYSCFLSTSFKQFRIEIQNCQNWELYLKNAKLWILVGFFECYQTL